MSCISSDVKEVSELLADNQNTVVVFTGDQDWAPEWAVQDTLDLFHEVDIPYHLFRTNDSQAARHARENFQGFSEGWHPNFLDGSSHGSTFEEVISEMARLVPHSRSIRCHSFYEYTGMWARISGTDIVAESHGLTDMQVGLRPMRMWTGLWRFPVFLEDDVFFASEVHESQLARLWRNLQMPGLKILNFHPVHVALNTSSAEQYTKWKSETSASVRSLPAAGFGTRSLLQEIIEVCRQRDLVVTSFENLISASLLMAEL